MVPKVLTYWQHQQKDCWGAAEQSAYPESSWSFPSLQLDGKLRQPKWKCHAFYKLRQPEGTEGQKNSQIKIFSTIWRIRETRWSLAQVFTCNAMFCSMKQLELLLLWLDVMIVHQLLPLPPFPQEFLSGCFKNLPRPVYKPGCKRKSIAPRTQHKSRTLYPKANTLPSEPWLPLKHCEFIFTR